MNQNKKVSKRIKSISEQQTLAEARSMRLFETAIIAGYKGSYEDWLDTRNIKTDEALGTRYQQARIAGYKGTFDDYKTNVMKKD